MKWRGFCMWNAIGSVHYEFFSNPLLTRILLNLPIWNSISWYKTICHKEGCCRKHSVQVDLPQKPPSILITYLMLPQGDVWSVCWSYRSFQIQLLVEGMSSRGLHMWNAIKILSEKSSFMHLFVKHCRITLIRWGLYDMTISFQKGRTLVGFWGK